MDCWDQSKLTLHPQRPYISGPYKLAATVLLFVLFLLTNPGKPSLSSNTPFHPGSKSRGSARSGVVPRPVDQLPREEGTPKGLVRYGVSGHGAQPVHDPIGGAEGSRPPLPRRPFKVLLPEGVCHHPASPPCTLRCWVRKMLSLCSVSQIF